MAARKTAPMSRAGRDIAALERVLAEQKARNARQAASIETLEHELAAANKANDPLLAEVKRLSALAEERRGEIDRLTSDLADATHRLEEVQSQSADAATLSATQKSRAYLLGSVYIEAQRAADAERGLMALAIALGQSEERRTRLWREAERRRAEQSALTLSESWRSADADV